MTDLNNIVFNSEFTLDFYHKEIEKYILDIQKANKPNTLIFEKISELTNVGIMSQSIDYVGSISKYSITENEDIIGTLNCFRNNENNYFILYTFNEL